MSLFKTAVLGAVCGIIILIYVFCTFNKVDVVNPSTTQTAAIEQIYSMTK